MKDIMNDGVTLHNIAPVKSMHDKFVDNSINVIREDHGQDATEYLAKQYLMLLHSEDESIKLKALSQRSNLIGLGNSTPIINIKSALPDMSNSDSLSDF